MILNSRKSLFFFVTLAILVITSCGKDEDQGLEQQPQTSNNTQLQKQVQSLPHEPLNSVELESLTFIREEEKLVRDVLFFIQ